MCHPPARCLVISDPRLAGHLPDPEPLRPLISGVSSLAICGPLLSSRCGRERSAVVRFVRRLQDICDREGTRLMLAGDADDAPLAVHQVVTLADEQVAVLPAGIADPADHAREEDAHEEEDRVGEWTRLLDLLERPAQSALRSRLTACGLLDDTGTDRESARRIATAVHAWRSLPARLRRTAQRLVPRAAVILTGISTHPQSLGEGAPPIVNLAASRQHPLGLAGMIDGGHLRVVGIRRSAADAISIGRAPVCLLPLSDALANAGPASVALDRR